jgi:hypothetical protein
VQPFEPKINSSGSLSSFGEGVFDIENPQFHTPTTSVLKYIVFAAMKLLKIQYKLKREKNKTSFRISEVKLCFISLCIPFMP